ncbi:MAG: leucine export protein LeuE [Methanocella sp. PtaU1.Bin125]|nr:MAG: leucine export protein LeuE [Methanocella sp. PtaU1.Bin125]
MLEVLIAAFIVGLTHAVPPGPITFEVLRRGAAEGLMPALKVDAGAVVADAVFFILIVIGLTQVINNPAGKLALWLGGSGLLMFLGLRGVYKALAARKKAADLMATEGSRKDTPPFLTGFLICITSPFAIIWWTSIFAGSMTLFNTDTITMAVVFAGVAIACLAWYALVGLSGKLSRTLFSPGITKALSLICSGMMIVFSLLLLYRGYISFL